MYRFEVEAVADAVAA